VRFAFPAVLAVLIAAVVAGCGGSGGQTGNLDGGTITVPGDVRGLYGELETFLAQLPYQGWFDKCVITTVKKEVSPAEAERFAKLPEASRGGKAGKIIAKAIPACEQSTDRPLIDPNASEKQLALYRAGNIAPLRELAEDHGLNSDQVACVEKATAELPLKKVVDLGNGSPKVREGIILSVFEPCAKVK
jgi:hypothetical protein